jgi:hypothetical protein
MANPTPDPVPSSPEELFARQRHTPPAPPIHGASSGNTVEVVLALLRERGAGNTEKRQIALTLLRQLEAFHDHVVKELVQDGQADHSELTRWAVEADRLYRARKILQTVELP